jgi:CBS domain containing-hemolysin-like protein
MIHCCHISLLTFLLLFFVGSMRKKQHCLLRYSESDAEHEGEIIDNGASNGAFDNDENSNVLRRNPLAPLSVGDVRNQQCRSSGKNVKKRHRIDYAGSDAEHEGEIIDNGASNGAFDNDENSNVLRRNPLAPLSVGDVRNQQCRSSGKKVKKRHRIDYAGSDAEHRGRNNR